METHCSSKLKIFADKTRLAILTLLEKRSLHVGDIIKHLNLEQSLVSHHLKNLRDSGFIRSCRDGKSVLYSITDKVKKNKKETSYDLGCCQITIPK